MTAPYQRIVSDLKRRIASGTLAPGARVPSTRVLAKEWKVATATAAHALRTLVQEGVLRAESRSGTVVAGRREEPVLSRDSILAAAIRIADEEGLDALSVRGVAARVGCPAMSLYRHVGSKEHLVQLMVDDVLGRSRPAEPSGRSTRGWRARLEWACRLEWQMMRRHPWVARVVHVSRPAALPNAAWYANLVLGALEEAKLAPHLALEVHVLLHTFIQGVAVNVEAEAKAVGETGLSEEDHMRHEQTKFESLIASGRYPAFAKVLRGMPEGFEFDLERVFDLGLRTLLDGLTPLINGKRRP